jgi:hypothetical protein
MANAKALNQTLSGGRELSKIRQKDPTTAFLLGRIIDSVNATAKSAAVSPVGVLSPPPPIDAIQVKGTFDPSTNTTTAPGEILHFTLTHNQAIQKGVQYISEVDTDPNFPAPHQIDHGCSRSAFLTLPTFKDDQSTKNTYYVRSYAQYHGSDPAKPTVFGGLAGATKIVMSGINSASPLPSQGSGTARNGQQGGQGIGKVLNRPAPGPKRNLK